MKTFTLFFLPMMSIMVIVLLCRVLYPASGHNRGIRTVLKHYLFFNTVYGLAAFSIVAVLVFSDRLLAGRAGVNMALAVFILTTSGLLNRTRIFRDVRPAAINLFGIIAVTVSVSGAVLTLIGSEEHASVLLKAGYAVCFIAVLGFLADLQCRFIIRLEKERIGRDVLKSIWMMVELILVQVPCLLIVSADSAGEGSCLAAICLAVLLQTSHSAEAAFDVYPSIWYENKIRLIMRKIEMNRTNGTIEEQDGMVVRLTEYFETKKPFLSPDLCLAEVALSMMTNKTTLSRVIHHQMKMSFRELVNRFRVKEAIAIYTDNMFLDVAELARLSGFRNNASFTNAFKLNIGKTPGAWCKEYKDQRNEIWKKEILETCDAGDRKKKEGHGFEPIFPKSGVNEPTDIS